MNLWLSLSPSRVKIFFSVVMPSDLEDLLVFMALSVMLLRLTYGSLPEGGYRLADGISTYSNSVKQMRNVVRLYRIELGESLAKIPISIYLNTVSRLVGHGNGR